MRNSLSVGRYRPSRLHQKHLAVIPTTQADLISRALYFATKNEYPQFISHIDFEIKKENSNSNEGDQSCLVLGKYRLSTLNLNGNGV